MRRVRRMVAAMLVTLVACGACAGGEGDGEATGSAPPDALAGPPRFRFVDATEAAGLGGFRQRNGSPEKRFIDESFGAGVALLDYDLDGDLDLYLTNGGTGERDDDSRDALFGNDGSGRFTDVTAAAGLGDERWTYGVTVADFDGDGDPDLYLTNNGPNRLYENRGDGTFEDVTTRAGVGDARWSSGAAFLDHDRDGDLDLYVANHIDLDRAAVERDGLVGDFFGLEVYYGPSGLAAERDAFFENQGDGTFRDVSSAAGIDAVELFGFQVAPFDYDGDGWVDVYVANDSTPNLLWRNQGDGTFEDVGYRVGVALGMNGDPQAGMGVAVGDYDGDVIPDIYVTNFSEDYFTLYRGSERGLFSDATRRANLYTETLPNLGWGTGFHDFDADGDLDLYVVNGHVFPQVDELGRRTSYLQRNQLFENLGTGRYAVPAGAGGSGFELAAASRGSAVGDLDGDGDLDLVVGNLDGPPSLLVNEGPQGRSLRVRLVGAGANSDALGARVVATVGARRMLRLVGTGDGFLSSSERTLHFGLGDAERVERLEVRWPDGTEATFGPLEGGATAVIRAGSDEVELVPYEAARGGPR